MKLNIAHLNIPIAIVALSGFYMHASQVDNALGLMVKKINKSTASRSFSKLSHSTKEIHVDSNHFLTKNQPTSSRPREDDDNEDNAKRRLIEEGYGKSFAGTIT